MALQSCQGVTDTKAGTGTLVGCLPNNFVAVNAGSRLGDMRQLSDLYDYKMLLLGRQRLASIMHAATSCHEC